MLADILPTGYEVRVLNGKVSPGDTVAVVGAGPIGLSAITGARTAHSPVNVLGQRFDRLVEDNAQSTPVGGAELGPATVTAQHCLETADRSCLTVC
jgi:D-arabinose 1-dehydrogenase-like Zn-dependent alcohol dehydrogenase